MKNIFLALSAVFLLSCASSVDSGGVLSDSEFKNPSQEYRPWVYWYWMNGNVTKEGALADIDAMAEVGIGGAKLMDVGIHPQGKVLYRSDEWWDIVKAVAERCKEKGIQISFNCPGWALAGGPWITPETAMQELTWSQTIVPSGDVSVTLPIPRHKLETYHDIAVLAYPVSEKVDVIPMAGAEFLDSNGNKLEAEYLKDPLNNNRVVLPNKFDIVFPHPIDARSLFICMDEMYTRINLELQAWDPSSESWVPVREFYSSNAAFAAQHAGGSFRKITSDRFRFNFREGNYLNFRTISFSSEYHIDNWTNRAGFSVDKDVAYQNDPTLSDDEIIAFDEIVNLTDLMDNAGNLKWSAPEIEGKKWSIMRIGYTPTGCTTNPPLYGVSQLEADKLSKTAALAHYEGMWKPVFEKLGKETSSKVLFANHIDSYEAGWQNWTSNMPAEFEQRNGYSIISYLLSATGLVIDSEETTLKFLWDFKRTISDMCAENFYGEITRLAEKDGLRHTSETYGGPFEYIETGTKVSIPMVEYWWPSSPYGKFYSDPIFAGHTTKAERIGYEAFTSGFDDKYVSHPYLLKNQGDKIFASGVNWFAIHVYAQQPYTDEHMMPGYTCGGNGVHFDRGNTWFFKSKPWIDYLSRCQYMLRLGEPVADVLYYTGAVNMSNHGPVSPFVPDGYEFDVVSSKQLSSLDVEDGDIVFPNGKKYRMIVYSPENYETDAALENLIRLAEKGAVVVLGQKPSVNPSLKDQIADNGRFERLVEKLWNMPAYSKGKGGVIMHGNDMSKVLSSVGVSPDYEKISGDLNLQMTHRRTSEEDIYFIANVDRKSGIVSCRLRVSGGVPEIYDPETGEVKECFTYHYENGFLVIDLFMENSQSLFVVVDNSSEFSLEGVVKERVTTKVIYDRSENGDIFKYDMSCCNGDTLRGQWKVSFTPGWGAPEQVVFPYLIPWNKHEDEGIRYYSGTAKYAKSIELPDSLVSGMNSKVFLDLGQVDIIAEVWVNGINEGILWKPPYIADITSSLKPGENFIEVEVVNNWQNRLIGDEQYPDDASQSGNWYAGGIPNYAEWIVNGTSRPVKDRLTFTSWKHLQRNDSLYQSGLVGPVRIYAVNGTKL